MAEQEPGRPKGRKRVAMGIDSETGNDDKCRRGHGQHWPKKLFFGHG